MHGVVTCMLLGSLSGVGANGLPAHVSFAAQKLIKTDQRRNVDDALMAEQFHGLRKGFRIDFVFADSIASELDDDPLLLSQRGCRPALPARLQAGGTSPCR